MSREKRPLENDDGLEGACPVIPQPQHGGKSSHTGNNKLTVETSSVFIMLWQEDLNCGNANYAFLLQLHIGNFFCFNQKTDCWFMVLPWWFKHFFPLSLKRKNACLSISLTSSEIIRKINVRAQRGLGTIWSKPLYSQISKPRPTRFQHFRREMSAV